MKAKLSILLLIILGLSITSCVSLKQSNYPVADLSHKSYTLRHEKKIVKETQKETEKTEVAVNEDIAECLKTLNEDNAINKLESKDIKTIAIESKEYTTMKDVRDLVFASSLNKVTAPFTKNKAKVSDTEYKLQNVESYGTLPAFSSATAYGQQQGYSIVSFVAGIVGIFFAALPLGIVAIIFGGIGMKKSLKGLAIAGLILGLIDVIAILLYFSTM